jgi:hypothetical protein
MKEIPCEVDLRVFRHVTTDSSEILSNLSPLHFFLEHFNDAGKLIQELKGVLYDGGTNFENAQFPTGKGDLDFILSFTGILNLFYPFLNTFKRWFIKCRRRYSKTSSILSCLYFLQ